MEGELLYWRQVIEASLSEEAMQQESRGRAPLLGTLKDTQKKALGMKHLSLHRDSVRRTWKGGYFTGDSKRHVKEGFGKGICLLHTGSVEQNLEVGLLY